MIFLIYTVEPKFSCPKFQTRTAQRALDPSLVAPTFAPLAVGGEATAQGGPRMPQRGAPHRGRLGERPTAVRGWRQVCGPCHPRWCHWLVRSGRMAPRQGLGVLPGQAPWFGEAFFFARDWGSPMFPSHCGVPLGSPLAPGWARWSKSSVARWRIWRRSPRGPKLWPPATRATERAMWSTWTRWEPPLCRTRLLTALILGVCWFICFTFSRERLSAGFFQ